MSKRFEIILNERFNKELKYEGTQSDENVYNKLTNMDFFLFKEK